MAGLVQSLKRVFVCLLICFWFILDYRGENSEGNKEEGSSLPSDVQGLGMGLPDLRSKRKGKQQVSKESHVSEALDKLREQTREAVKGLESVSDPKPTRENLGNDAMMEDWVKQFEEFAGSPVILSNFLHFKFLVVVYILPFWRMIQ